MDIGTLWGTIIIPLLVGPLFIYLKSIYDRSVQNKKEHNMLVYNNNYDYLTKILNAFYWPLYLKLLCIYQLNYSIPLKNDFEYVSTSDSEDNQDNIAININSNKDIILDTETIKKMEDTINKLFNETLDIIENNIYVARISRELNKHIVHFIKYCKIRQIIHEGSPDKKYNIEYFGIKDNTKKLLNLIEFEVLKYQSKFNTLVEEGPFK